MDSDHDDDFEQRMAERDRLRRDRIARERGYTDAIESIMRDAVKQAYQAAFDEAFNASRQRAESEVTAAVSQA